MPSAPESSELERRIQALEAALAESHRTEAALREREAKQRFLIEHMTDTLWTLDLALRPTYVSPASLAVLGFTPEERMTQTLAEMVTPETYGRAAALLARELEKEGTGRTDPDRTLSIEMEYYHKAGHTVWLENRIRAIRDGEGRLAGLHGVSRNIDKRRRAEEALRESEERFRLLSGLTSDIVYSCVTGADGVFTLDWMWGNVEEITGYRLEEVLAFRCWSALVVAEDRPLFERCVTGLAPGETREVDLRLRRKDGGIAWVLSCAECREEEPPGIRRLHGALVDVTERKQAEEMLRRKEADLNRLIEALPLAVMVEIRDRIAYANPAFVRLFGAPSTEAVLGTALQDFIAPEMIDEIRERRRTMMRERQPLPPLELKLRRLDGEVLTVVSSPIPIDFQAQYAVLNALYDITEHKRNEIELQKARRLIEMQDQTIETLRTRLKAAKPG